MLASDCISKAETLASGTLLTLELHPAILKPDLDLSFGQLQQFGNLDSSSTGQVAVRMELLLELQRLVSRVRLTGAFAALRLLEFAV